MLNFASVLHPHLVYSIEVDANTFHGSLISQPTIFQVWWSFWTYSNAKNIHL